MEWHLMWGLWLRWCKNNWNGFLKGFNGTKLLVNNSECNFCGSSTYTCNMELRFCFLIKSGFKFFSFKQLHSRKTLQVSRISIQRTASLLKVWRTRLSFHTWSVSFLRKHTNNEKLLANSSRSEIKFLFPIETQEQKRKFSGCSESRFTVCR